MLTTLLYEMQKRDAKKGLATLCIGGGMGIAMCVERVEAPGMCPEARCTELDRDGRAWPGHDRLSVGHSDRTRPEEEHREDVKWHELRW